MARIWNTLLYPFRLARQSLQSFRAWAILVIMVIVLLIAYYVVADRYTPLTNDAYVQAYVVQVASRVEGQVIRVHVKEDERVHKGQLLFEIDPRPFEHKVAELEARLAFTVQQVAQLKTDLEAAQAEHQRIEAEERYAKAVYGQEDQIFKKDATTERKYLDAVQKHKASMATLERSAKLVQKAEQALEARIGSEHALIAEVKAVLASARLNLEYTRIYAPADGYITNLQLREGAYAHVGQAVLTCIDTSQWLIVANYRENCLERLTPGHPAWISFNDYPGRVYHGRVSSIGWGVSQGQGVPSGQLPHVPNMSGWIRVAQRFQVRLELDDPDAVPLRVGMTATATVFVDPDSPVNPLTRGAHHLLSWLDFIY